MLDNALKLQMNQQRTSIRVTVGISRVNEDGTVDNYLPIGLDLSDVENQLKDSGLRYYIIKHDQDGDYIHYHLVLVSNINRRIKTWLNTLSTIFACDVVNIQIIDCVDFTLAVQYLIHKNDFDKYQYERSKIITNDSKDHLDEILDTTVSYGECISMKDIIDVCRTSRGLDEVYQKFSPSFLKQNLGIINSLARYYGKF